MNHVNSGDKISWELEQNNVAVYAVQGHRDHMEDRFIVNNDIDRTGVSVFAVFDGHGGEVIKKNYFYICKFGKIIFFY